MKCQVAGKTVAQTELTARDLGFGGLTDPNSILPCQCEMDFEEFAALFEPLYRGFCEETRQEVSDGVDPDPSSLHEANYPPLAMLASRYPQVLKEVVVEYLALNFCQLWVGKNQSLGECHFVINDIRDVEVGPEGRWIKLFADVYKMNAQQSGAGRESTSVR